MPDELRSLLERARDELYTAKAQIRQTRNHVKLAAAVLADREAGIDALLAELESARAPIDELTRGSQAQGGSTNDGNDAEAQLAHRPG
jgi:hypothetical protein